MKNYSRLLQKYAQVMLPPAPEQGVLMPSFTQSKAPDTKAINEEQMRRVEEMEKAKGEGAEAQALKMKHIEEMLKALDEGGEDAFFGTPKQDAQLADSNNTMLPPSPEEEVDVNVPQTMVPSNITEEEYPNMPMMDPSFDPSKVDLDFEMHKGLLHSGLISLLRRRYQEEHPDASWDEIKKMVSEHLKHETNTAPASPQAKKNASLSSLLKKCDFYFGLTISE